MKILVLRFSAMGDVAILSVVMKALLDQNPNAEIWMLSRPHFKPLFSFGSERLHYVEADLQHKYAGTTGMYKLFNDINQKGPFDFIFDMHDVMRTWGLSTLFTLRNAKIFRINKGRADKRKLVAKSKKQFKQLPTTLERYAKVCRDAGFNLDLNRLKLGPLQIDASDEARHFFNDHPGSWVGIAPFAKHKGKRYPLEKMEDLIAKIVDQYDFVMLFGGGPKEIQKLESLEAKFKNAISLAGKFSLDDELFLMMNLKWMLCMDSANMHMAALAGVRTFSIWGATHPYAGFLSYNHKEEDVIQIAHDELDCRPCSVYGNKSCHRGDYACLNWITTEMILNKLQF